VVPGWRSSNAFAVSDDGLVIGGSVSGIQDPTGFIWTPATGMLTAASFLGLHSIGLPAGWRIEEVFAISGDGLTFAGQAISAAGSRQGFVATVPSPPSIVILVPALAFTHRRRRG
jgi:probable HAF family extracellular repeat protein